MDVKKLKQDVIEFAQEIGIDKIRFASADTFETLKERLIENRALGYESGFEEPDLEKRTNPDLLLPKAKSIIAIALAYPSKMKDAPRSKKGERRGIFCRASWGKDYHHVLREKLDQLEEFLKAQRSAAISERNRWLTPESCRTELSQSERASAGAERTA